MLRARGLVIGVVAAGVLLAGVASAWDEDSGAEGVSAALHCGDTITRSTRLTRDLACPGSPEPALRIVGENVTLDLGGHTVRGTAPDGSESEGIAVMADSTVRNGTIRGFRFGYVLYGGSNVALSRLTFVDNGLALYNRGTATFTISNSRLLGNSVGLTSEQDASSGAFLVRSTLFLGNGLAISANNFHSVEVLQSTFALNDTVFSCRYGSFAFTSSWILQNTVVAEIPFDEGGYQLCTEVSLVDTVISRNQALASTAQPVWKPFSLVLRDSHVVANGSGALVRTNEAHIEGSTWQDNGGGLTLAETLQYLQPTLTGTVSDNHFLRNRGDGFRVTVSSTLTLSGNVAIGNTGWGIHAPGVIDGGGNVARRNGAGNCVGVLCSPH